MMFTNRGGRFAVFSCAILIAGCGGSQPPSDLPGVSAAQFEDPTRPMPGATGLPSLPKRHVNAGWFSPRRVTRTSQGSTLYLYIADQSGNDVDIYSENGRFMSPVGEVADGINGPYGLYVDRDLALYVANQNNNTVTKYPYGATSPSVTYSQDLARPLYPLVDRQGDLFVSNAKNGTVVEYLAGSTAAYRILQTPGVEADGMDFDQHGNLYVAYRMRFPTGSIEEFAPGSTQGTVLGMTLNQPQGVIVDKNDNVLAVETGGTNRVDVFAPGAQTPYLVEGTWHTPTQLALDRRELEIFLSELNGIVYAAPFPLQGVRPFGYIKDETSSLIQGVTISDDQF